MLPFTNLSDSADEYFADGLTEDLIHALSLQSFYRVLSRSSTFAFKGKNLSARLIAREIDATYLIQGSVRRAGNKIRVTAELIAPENGEQLWTGRYDRDMGDLFALQDEITTSLSAALAPEIFRAEASAPARASSTDLTAWDRFLKGLSHYYQQTKAGLRSLDRAVQGGHRARSVARDRARLSRHQHAAERAVWMDPAAPANCGPRRWSWPKAASGSIRARPSPSRSCPMCTSMEGQLRAGTGRPRRRASSSIPMTWARAASLASVTWPSASIARRSNCFRPRRSTATPIPAINGAALQRVQPLSSAAI